MRGLALLLITAIVVTLLCLTAVRAANATANCPTSDQLLWVTSEFAVVEDNLQQCGLQSLALEAEARTCLQARSDLSNPCVECQVTLVTCTSQFCTGECANGGRANPRCVRCVEDDSPCNNNFRTCSGLAFPDCPTCVQPIPKSSGNGEFIPGLGFGGSIGVVVGGGVCVILAGIAIAYITCIRDTRVDFNPSQHSLHDLHSQGSMGSITKPGSDRNLMQVPNALGGLGGSFHTNPNPRKMNSYTGPAYARNDASAVPAPNIMDDI